MSRRPAVWAESIEADALFYPRSDFFPICVGFNLCQNFGMKTVRQIFVFISFLPALVFSASEETKEIAQKDNEEVIGHPFSWPFVSWEKMKPYGGTTKASRTEIDPKTKPSFAAIYENDLTKKEQDRRAILALAGDHRVSFDFIETASSASAYQPARPYFSWATERAFVIEDKGDFISLQHVLVMEFVDDKGEVQGPFVMKHWRQDWSYESKLVVEFRGEQTWKKRKLTSWKGTWVQAVYQVDDSPRYQTAGRWSHEGGLSIFRSRNFWRPLPRREFSVRDDYNVLGGRHEITVTPRGWVHTQFNQKLLTKNGEIEKTLATELGAVRYERITSPSLIKSEDYWANTKDFWAAVRSTWTSLEKSGRPFSLRSKLEDKPMYSYLFALADQFANAERSDRNGIKVEAMAVIGRFLADSNGVEAGY